MTALIISLLFFVAAGHADSFSSECGQMEVRDISMGMCMPIAMDGMNMIMLRGNGFGTYTTEQGPRGRRDFAGPNMFMFDVGRSIQSVHYLNLDYMGTFERWTIPMAGYPELLQIGESNSQGVPFIDAQHPHSSPVMGLTLSDNIRLNDDKDFLKLFFAPRGETTDGPIAFMHRPTGIANPDAPLGHHIGQDVGHVSSTVIGASLGIERLRLELSTFHGEEPQPDRVNLPVGSPDSGAFRVMYQFTPHLLGMTSVAYVRHPETQDAPDVDHEWRYSASLYREDEVAPGWKLYRAAIYGLVTGYDHASTLSSVAFEFLLRGPRPRLWGRFEYVDRTPAELGISEASDQNRGRGVGALTLGYSHRVVGLESAELDIGGSVTKDLLPGELIGAYGGNPWTGRIFVQVNGSGMWDW